MRGDKVDIVRVARLFVSLMSSRFCMKVCHWFAPAERSSSGRMPLLHAMYSKDAVDISAGLQTAQIHLMRWVPTFKSRFCRWYTGMSDYCIISLIYLPAVAVGVSCKRIGIMCCTNICGAAILQTDHVVTMWIPSSNAWPRNSAHPAGKQQQFFHLLLSVMPLNPS